MRRLRVDHDFAEDGVEEPHSSSGDARRLDVDVAAGQRSRALDVQRRAKYGAVEARDIAAHVLSHAARSVGCRGRLRGRRNRSLLSSVSCRPRPALGVVDGHRDAL